MKRPRRFWQPGTKFPGASSTQSGLMFRYEFSVYIVVESNCTDELSWFGLAHLQNCPTCQTRTVDLLYPHTSSGNLFCFIVYFTSLQDRELFLSWLSSLCVPVPEVEGPHQHGLPRAHIAEVRTSSMRGKSWQIGAFRCRGQQSQRSKRSSFNYLCSLAKGLPVICNLACEENFWRAFFPKKSADSSPDY